MLQKTVKHFMSSTACFEKNFQLHNSPYARRQLQLLRSEIKTITHNISNLFLLTEIRLSSDGVTRGLSRFAISEVTSS